MAWVENIFFADGEFRLDIPRWDFPETGVSCVWGSSGSGKTTLLHILGGLIHSPNLKLSVGGQLISELPVRKRNTGFVFQDYSLFPHLTAFENIAFAAEAKDIPKDLWCEHAEHLIHELDLIRIRDSKALILSGGEQQRVALARALVTKPSLVLLDEPLSALDEKNRDEARELILRLSVEYQVPFILVTHDLRDVRALSQWVLVLDEGKAVAAGLTQSILDDPDTLKLAQMIPENQVFPLKNSGGKYLFQNTEITARKKVYGGPPFMIAKDWSFEAVATHGGSLRARVRRVYNEGARRRVYLELADGQSIKAWSSLTMGELTSKVGHELDLKVNPDEVILLVER